MSKLYSPNEILITDTTGRIFSVSPLSFSDRERFREYLQLLMDIVKEEPDQSIDFIDLYDSNPRVHDLCRLIFSLHDIPVDEISPDLLFQLLFPSEGQDMGILARINVLKPRSIGRDSNKEVVDAYHKLLAQIFEVTGSLDEAVKAFTNVPAATLLSTMEALAEIRRATDPKAQKEDKKSENMEKVREMQAKAGSPPVKSDE